MLYFSVVWFYNHSFYFIQNLCAFALIQLIATFPIAKNIVYLQPCCSATLYECIDKSTTASPVYIPSIVNYSSTSNLNSSKSHSSELFEYKVANIFKVECSLVEWTLTLILHLTHTSILLERMSSRRTQV